MQTVDGEGKRERGQLGNDCPSYMRNALLTYADQLGKKVSADMTGYATLQE